MIKNKRAFTLLELMLVLVIAAILAVMAIQFFRQYTLNQKIKLAAYQTKQLLTAASNWYIDGIGGANTWPIIAQATTPLRFLTYVSGVPIKKTNDNQYYVNPWGNPYTGRVVTGSNGAMYEVSSVVPDAQIAFRAAGYLPLSSNTDASNNILTGYMPAPGVAPENSPIEIARIGQVVIQPPSSKVMDGCGFECFFSTSYSSQNFTPDLLFTCPPGYSGYVQFMINSMKNDLRGENTGSDASWTDITRGPRRIGTQNVSNDSQQGQLCSNSEGNTWQCNMKFYYTSEYYHAYTFVSYLQQDSMGWKHERYWSKSGTETGRGQSEVNYLAYCKLNGT